MVSGVGDAVLVCVNDGVSGCLDGGTGVGTAWLLILSCYGVLLYDRHWCFYICFHNKRLKLVL